MMTKFGWGPGDRLGAKGQGIAEPLQIKIHKDRTGLGANEEPETEDYDMEFINTLAWNLKDEKIDWNSAKGDRIWSHKNPFLDNEFEAIEEVYAKLLSFDLNDENCRGKTPKLIDSTYYANPSLCQAVCYYKSQLNNIDRQILLEARIRSNPYELIKSGFFMNRAAMKMANMDALFGNIFSKAIPENDTLYFADVCAGPGGFSEYMLWRRCNGMRLQDSPCDDDVPSVDRFNLFPIKGFGFTLKGENDFKKQEFRASPSELFRAHYGLKSGDGNIFNWPNQYEFVKYVATETKGEGVHVFLADGGFDVKAAYNEQEIMSKQLYLCQCLMGLMILRPGGVFLTKVFDLFTDFSAHLIYLMSFLFEEIFIVKPLTSRPANSERYLLCKNLYNFHEKDTLVYMAGCPEDPLPRTDKPNDESFGNNQVYKPPSNSKGNLPTKDLSKFYEKDKLVHTAGCQKDPLFRTEKPNDKSFGNNQKQFLEYSKMFLQGNSALAKVIMHLVNANEILNSYSSQSSKSSKTLLLLCNPAILRADQAFMKFLTESNNQFSEMQCFNLSKLKQYSNLKNLSHIDEQESMKEIIYQAWNIPKVQRFSGHWPLWQNVIKPILRSPVELGEPQNLSKRHKSSKIECFTKQNIDDTFHARCHVAIIVPYNKKPNEPIMVYSKGQVSKNKGLFCSHNGEPWKTLDSQIPLPPGSIVYGIFSNHYPSRRVRKENFTILDVFALNGHDCRCLSYRQRITLAEKMVENVNFSSDDEPLLRSANVILLSDLPFFFNKLMNKPCKDLNALMYKEKSGYSIYPDSVFIVKHVERPWIEVEDSSGVYSYYNIQTEEKRSFLEKNDLINYEQTVFRKMSFKSIKNDDFDLFKLSSMLNEDPLKL